MYLQPDRAGDSESAGRPSWFEYVAAPQGSSTGESVHELEASRTWPVTKYWQRSRAELTLGLEVVRCRAEGSEHMGSHMHRTGGSYEVWRGRATYDQTGAVRPETSLYCTTRRWHGDSVSVFDLETCERVHSPVPRTSDTNQLHPCEPQMTNSYMAHLRDRTIYMWAGPGLTQEDAKIGD